MRWHSHQEALYTCPQGERCVSVLTAHKILISSAVVLFVLYAAWEWRNYSGGDLSALPRSLMSAGGAGALAIYLRWVWVHRPGRRQQP